MKQSVSILGRQPAIGLAELESLFGADNLKPFGEHAAVVDIEPAHFPIDKLGSIIKVCKMLTFLPYTDWPSIYKYLAEALPRHLEYIPDGKIHLGLSCYGVKVSTSQINASALSLKKIIKAAGRSVRVVPNQAPQLNTAQVLHNNLTGETGMELILISDGEQTLLCQTSKVQDINAYAERDQMRPKRDPRVGMLPPKLAQIIINLSEPSEKAIVLDPFCGTGVIPQEALLMGFNAYGSDIEPRMVDYTITNLEWLSHKYRIGFSYKAEVADACTHEWQKPFDRIASETYLGRPFSAEPKPDVLIKIVQDIDFIHKKFLQNVAKQTKSGFKMCIAVPAWKTANGFRQLSILDHLEELGYTRQSFVHVRNGDLIYHRPNQIVARELVVLVRK